MLVVLNDWVSINPNDVAWMHVVDMGRDDKSATRWLDIKMRDGRKFQSELGGDPYYLKKTIERLLKPHHGSGARLKVASGKPYDPTTGPLAEAQRRARSKVRETMIATDVVWTAGSRARKKAKRA